MCIWIYTYKIVFLPDNALKIYGGSIKFIIVSLRKVLLYNKIAENL